jgi:hypothetical protein
MRDRPINQRDLPIEEVELTQSTLERLAFLDGQFELGQPRAALLAEQITDVRAALQTADQDRVDLVLRTRARPDQLRSARQPASHRANALVGHPDAVQRARGQQLRVRASKRSVFARAWRMPVSLGETTTTRATCASMFRAISHALPVTSNTTRSSLLRLCANNSSTSGRVAIRPADRTAPASAIAISEKSRCTSSPIALTLAPFADIDDTREPWANDTDASALAAQPGQSQGRPSKSSGSKPIDEMTACPRCVLPRAPRPVPGP